MPMLKAFPAWGFWLMLVAVLALVWIMWTMYGNLIAMRQELAAAGGKGGGPPRTRRELEEAYTKGLINRDMYDRLKGRVQ